MRLTTIAGMLAAATLTAAFLDTRSRRRQSSRRDPAEGPDGLEDSSRPDQSATGDQPKEHRGRGEWGRSTRGQEQARQARSSRARSAAGPLTADDIGDAPPVMHRDDRSRTAGSRQGSEPPTSEAILEAQELPSAIGAGSIIILDVRDQASYDAGHLPRAVHVDYERWAHLSMDEPTGLKHDDAWRVRIGKLGVSADSDVIIYDDGKMTNAARIWFILQHFGVRRVRVVNGGFPLIDHEVKFGKLRLSTDHEPHERVTFKPMSTGDNTAMDGQAGMPQALQPQGDEGEVKLIERQELFAAMQRGDVQVLDTRSREEFEGREQRKNPRGGHLPGARNIPHAEFLDQRGRLRSPEELDALLSQAGFVKGKPIATHCESGGRSSLAALAAARAGYRPVLNYYLSFGDWAKDWTCPVVAEVGAP
ncbi:MAG: rhodanese-like domain-containing protein [Planctomycetota bacterium]|nr:rhodanese-like domain-containing protein [Planctomycetota bacterium]